MSLINDALKRANHSLKRQPKPDGAGALPTTLSSARPDGAGVLVIVIVLLLVGGLAYLGWGWYSGKQAASQAAANAKKKPKAGTANSMAGAAAGTPSNPVAVAKNTFEKVQTANTEGENLAKNLNAPHTAAPTATADPAGDSFPTLKLQGIMFSKSNPSALINRTKVHVGDDIEGVRVTAIEVQKVTLKKGDQTKELVLK